MNEDLKRFVSGVNDEAYRADETFFKNFKNFVDVGAKPASLGRPGERTAGQQKRLAPMFEDHCCNYI